MNPSRNHHQNQADNSSWNHNQHLDVNMLSKPITKSSLPRPPPPSFQPATVSVHPRPHVYHVSKNDFRDIVQQLTGTTSRDPNPSLQPPPPTNPQAPLLPPHQSPYYQPNERLQKIRPPPLSSLMPPPLPARQNPNEIANFPSPLTAYMQYLESSLLGTSRNVPAQSGLLPPPEGRPLEALVVASPPLMQIPSPAFLQSPTAFANLILPIGFQYPNPLTRNPALSPGTLGPIPGFNQSSIPSPMPSLSPGFLFPNSPNGLLSPSNYFLIQSPMWRNG